MHAAIRVVTRIFPLIPLLLITACSSLPKCPSNTAPFPGEPQPQSHHVVELDADGHLLDLKRRAITDTNLVAAYIQTNIFAGFHQSGKKKILVFVHGGMNDRKTGLSHFKDDYKDIMGGDYYPVFIVWPSGWTDTYLEHLLWVRQGVKAETGGEKTFSLVTSPFMFVADLGRSVMRLPLVLFLNTRNDLSTVYSVRSREQGRAAVAEYQQLTNSGLNVGIGNDYSKGSDRSVRFLSYCVTLPFKYTISCLIDGFGQGAWDDMLRRTQEVYPDTANPESAPQKYARKHAPQYQQSAQSNTKTNTPASAVTFRQQRRAANYASSGFPAFIELLREEQKTNKNLEVTLVGHSMGTIILNRVLREETMEFTNIVYMGGACTIADFESSVLPYLKDHKNANFYNLSLHPVAEAGEWQASMADLVPRGSLLVWLDNFLMHPVTEQERTFGRWENLYLSDATGQPFIHRFFESDNTTGLRQRMHFEAFSVGYGDEKQMRALKWQWNEKPVAKTLEQRCNAPLAHGDFSEMPYWDSGFWWNPARFK